MHGQAHNVLAAMRLQKRAVHHKALVWPGKVPGGNVLLSGHLLEVCVLSASRVLMEDLSTCLARCWTSGRVLQSYTRNLEEGRRQERGVC